jgi:hypothetical protein
MEGNEMKKIIFTLLIAFVLTGNAFALTGTTNQGGLACISEEYLSDAISFIVDNDTQNLEAFLTANKCVFMKEGLKVNIVKYPVFGNIIFVYQGLRFHAPKSAVEVDRGN